MGNEGLKCKEKGLIVNMRENKKLEIERISEDRCNEEGWIKERNEWRELLKGIIVGRMGRKNDNSIWMNDVLKWG